MQPQHNDKKWYDQIRIKPKNAPALNQKSI